MSDSARQLDILLVEDNDADVYLTQVAFRDALTRNRLHVVNNGREALDFLRRAGNHALAPQPDLVLLDLNLPLGIDGFEVLAEMKSDPTLRRIPVIVISGSDRPEDKTRASELQVAAYLVKPPEVDRYFAAVRQVKELWFHTLSLAPRPEAPAPKI